MAEGSPKRLRIVRGSGNLTTAGIEFADFARSAIRGPGGAALSSERFASINERRKFLGRRRMNRAARHFAGRAAPDLGERPRHRKPRPRSKQMKPRIPAEIPSDPDLDAADAEAHAAHELSIELFDAILAIVNLEKAAETDAERKRLADRRAQLEAEHAAAELRKQGAQLQLATARAASQEQEILRTLINAPAPPRAIARRPATITRSRARSSRGCSSRTRGSRRTARSTGPPGGEDGDPDPPGVKARTGRVRTKGRRIASIGGPR